MIDREYQVCYKTAEEFWSTLGYVGGYVTRQSIGKDKEILKDFEDYVLNQGLNDHKTDQGHIFVKKVIFTTAEK